MTEQLFLAVAGLVFGGFAVALLYAHANTVDREARTLGRNEQP